MTFIVYKITNSINSNIYFGYTSKILSKRLREHTKKSSGCKILKRSINKYGKENFVIESLFEFDNIYEAHTTEIFLIAINRTNICRYPDGNGMNMTDGGGGTNGHIFTKEAKLKIGIKSKGNKYRLGILHSKETKKKISESGKGKKRSDKSKVKYSFAAKNRSAETLSKLSKAQKGKIMSDESKKKMSKVKKGINHPRCRSISQYSIDNIFIQKYSYIKEAEKQTNISSQNIWGCCNGKSKTAGGFIWKYSEVK